MLFNSAVLPQYHFRTVRYRPNAVSGEFLNIGLLLFRQDQNELRFAQARWLPDFGSIRRLDPRADPAVVRGACDELESRLRYGADSAKLAASLQGAIQLTGGQPITEPADPAAILDSLAQLYFSCASPSDAAIQLARALHLLRAVPTLEGNDKDLVEKAMEAALGALQSSAPTDPADDDCPDGEHCSPQKKAR